MSKFVRLTPMHTFWIKVALHATSLLLLLYTYYQALNDQLGADPVAEILHFTGIGAFNLLLICLLVSPLAKYFRQGQLITLRRPLGLYAFAYAACHFASYLLFDLQLDWSLIFDEIIKRPYITVGFIALLILSLLAATSTKSIQRRMGRTWQKTHNWVYLAGIMIALHYIWSVKSDLVQPSIYALGLLVLLATRKAKFIRPFKSKLNKTKKKLA